MRSNYQLNYADEQPSMYDPETRVPKAAKTIAVLDDYCAEQGVPLDQLNVLDIGCSAGIMTEHYAAAFGSVVGVDIDARAMHAAQDETQRRAGYVVGDSMQLCFRDASFDAVTCTHIYEHVPDASRLMAEIYRVLVPGGVCYFAAGNRLSAIEPHHRLPLLSVVPKAIAHRYMRLMRRGPYYYETHYTLRGLERLVSRFRIVDYTRRIITDPMRFQATDVVSPGSRKQRLASFIAQNAYWVVPTYIWVLVKPNTADIARAHSGAPR